MTEKYAVTIGAVIVAVIAAGVALTIWAPGDTGRTLTLLLGFAAPTVTALLAVQKSQENGVKAGATAVKTDQIAATQTAQTAKAAELHDMVNSRLSELVKSTSAQQFAAGVLQGQANPVIPPNPPTST